MTLKERIRESAKKKDLSLPRLEEELGFGSGTISKWDKSAPSSEKLARVADKLEVSIDYLLGREEAPHYVQTIAAHFDGDEYTEQQLERIREFARFIKEEDKRK